ncbi:MAG: stage II sporulation protein R [Lachnospiraceae bacterium]|jgi:stage II sporulation protein R|nr:stage II sporulation protein R [Lachnospiraceae bacterium]
MIQSREEIYYHPECNPDNLVHKDEIKIKIAKKHWFSIILAWYLRWSNRLRVFLLLLIMIFSGIVMGCIQAGARKQSKIQTGIAKEIIRFHVIANSDSREDQALKIKVKDYLVTELSPYLKEAKSIDRAREILSEMLPDIQEAAQEVIRENGYDYPVLVSLEPCFFPLKVYGDYTFPPGTYEALRVKIGRAEGKNWWCVMFPPLCFVDETYSIVNEESEEQLKVLLTEEEFESLKLQKAPVKIKFKLWEEFKAYFKL